VSLQITSQKKKIRSEIQKRSQYHSEFLRRRSAELLRTKLIQDKKFQIAKVVGFFSSDAHEIDTFPLFELALQLGKRAVFPRVEGKDLKFYEVSQKSDLLPGFMGILEPLFGSEVPLSKIDWLFVPAVAFDYLGNRLGRGKGFYDRLLGGKNRPKETVGLSYFDQVVSKLPVHPWDQMVDRVLTERGWLFK